MWKFSKLKDTNSTHPLYMYGKGIQCAHVPHCTGVGHCIVYFSLGLSTTFKQIFEFNSTLSFFLVTDRPGVKTVHKHLIIMKKTLSVIGSFCLGISLSIAVIACANDNDHTTPLPEILVNDCVPTILSYDHGYGTFDINFNYDDNGRLTGAKLHKDKDVEEVSKEISFNISYSGTTITIVEEINYRDGKTYTYSHTVTVSEDDIVNVQAYNLALFLTVFKDIIL